ncbi:MAG: hypothetical protein HYX38_34540 [Rhodospirillales bacterium]|nr:hypothetical protein [Rhodospirillales bacterium]
MNRIGVLELAGLLVLASLGAAAQQPSTPAPSQGQQMQREHNMGGMGQGQGTNQGQGGMGMGGMGQGNQGQGTTQGQGGTGQNNQGMGQGNQGQGGMGMGGMGGMMDHMHKGPGTPPSSAHAPASPGATTPQCPAGTTIQMDDKGQHICR